jgi:hypothetical protein
VLAGIWAVQVWLQPGVQRSNFNQQHIQLILLQADDTACLPAAVQQLH